VDSKNIFKTNIMKRKIYLFVIGIFAFSSVYAQILDNKMIRLMDEFNELKRVFPSKEKEYEGSPYLTDAFDPGSIQMKDGNIYNDIPLRYNIHSDQVEFKQDEEAMAIQNPKNIKEVKIGNRVFVFCKYGDNSKQDFGYFEKIMDGKYSLYLRHRVILKAGGEAGAYQAATKPTFHLQKPDHYIVRNDSQPIKFKNSDDILSAYKDLEEPIKEYAGKKRIKLKKEEDYINLVKYLNKGQ